MMIPNNSLSNKPWVYLSQVPPVDDPAYIAWKSMKITQEKSISQSNSCNIGGLECSIHLGSHIDALLHFKINGRSVDD